MIVCYEPGIIPSQSVVEEQHEMEAEGRYRTDSGIRFVHYIVLGGWVEDCARVTWRSVVHPRRGRTGGAYAHLAAASRAEGPTADSQARLGPDSLPRTYRKRQYY